ncbi:MAG: sterol desaturase family protein [Bacteroidetes bacterium]|nr:sterol desaturase family protein [Bacteroidota bacterium]
MQLSTDTISGYFSSLFSKVPDAVITMIRHPSGQNYKFWENPFWALIVVWITTFIFEQILPRNKNYSVLGRKGFFLDLFYLFFIDFLFGIIGFIALTYTIEFVFTNGMKNIGVSFPLANLGKLPFILQFLVFFIVMDFSQFIAHYLLHRINFFWRFHKIHHAQETLGFASTRHFHFMEYLVLRPFGWIPMGLLGYSDEKYIVCTALYMWIAYFLVFFSHCNVKVNFGILNKIIITPNTHYWHHAKNIPRKFGVNYASVLVFWDLLFRTFYLPGDPKIQPQLGVPDKEVPQNFMGQMIYPFRNIFSKKKDPQMMISEGKKKK